jgi:hypothetical protein
MAFVFVDVAGVMRNCAIHHGFGHLRGLSPNRHINILLEFNLILLAFLQVSVLRRTTIATESFVVANMSGVTDSKAAEHGVLQRRDNLFSEILSGTEGHHVGVEGAVLADNVRKGLVLVHNLAIEAGIFVSF